MCKNLRVMACASFDVGKSLIHESPDARVGCVHVHGYLAIRVDAQALQAVLLVI